MTDLLTISQEDGQWEQWAIDALVVHQFDTWYGAGSWARGERPPSAVLADLRLMSMRRLDVLLKAQHGRS